MRTLHFCICSMWLLACGDGGSASGAGPGGGGGEGGGGTAGSGGGSGECTPQPGVTPGPDWVCVTEVTGRVIDESDAPVADVFLSVCGPGGCEPADSEPSGDFTIEVGFELLPDDFSLIPHAREHGKLVHYVPLADDEPGPKIDVGTVHLLDAPADGPALVVKTDNAGAPAQNLTSGDVNIDVPSGVRVNLDFEDVSLGDEGKEFRARKVPDALLSEYAGALSPAAMYAFTPFESSFDLESDPGTPAKIRLAFSNTTGLAANTPVAFYQLGSFVVGTIEAGDYQQVATGAVSSDGATITMDPGEGFEFLSWIAIVATGN